VAFPEGPLRPGVEKDGLPRRPEVLPFLERDQADAGIFRLGQEGLPEFSPGETLDEGEMDCRSEEDAQGPDHEDLPDDLPCFAQGVISRE
jgi:hypothetical protein